MADIRIKDLTTTASSTASDDFIAVDGTTNGTRKLSAFSPTFGGNATVTGTLTVNSSNPSVFAGQVRSNLSNASLSDTQIFVRNPSASLTNGAVSQAAFFGQPGYTTFVGTTGDGTTASYQGGVLGSAIRFNEGYVITDAANGLLLHGINGSIRLATGNPGSVKATFDSAGTLYLTATTASTNTSSGALVVGNGTSGGLGVGGDANIGGSLTVTGASNGIICNGAGLSLNTAGSASVRFQDAGVSKWWIYKLSGDPWLYFRDMVNGRMQLQMVPGATSDDAISTFNSKVDVGSTISSTVNTNSGVLQLNLVNSSTGTSASSLFRFNAGTRTATLQAYNDTHATLAGQLRVGTSNGDIVLIPSGVAATTFGSSTVTVNHSTASTSTSSGALVVSGGVGVAGKISAGGDVVAFNDSVFASATTWVGRSDGTNASLYLRANGTGKVIVDTGTGGLDVSAGPIRTAAPSGGTAANWKLGSVAAVSPTSPNRTIEVDIGGTIYYIHAKTTNN